MSPLLISSTIVILVSLIVILPAMRHSPGLGVIGGLVVMGIVLWQRGQGLAAVGLSAPADWWATVTLALISGLLLALLSQIIIDPIVERYTGQPHDISVVEGIRSNLTNLLIFLVSVWLLVALVEEVLYRGFLMTELAQLLGTAPWALALNLLISSTVFGLSHWYQGVSGVWSTGILGALLGLLFIWTGFNVWAPLLAHGVIDTVLLIFIYLDIDQRLKHLLVR